MFSADTLQQALVQDYGRLCTCLLYTSGFGTGKARVLQVLADQIPNARFIVNDQYSCHF